MSIMRCRSARKDKLQRTEKPGTVKKKANGYDCFINFSSFCCDVLYHPLLYNRGLSVCIEKISILIEKCKTGQGMRQLGALEKVYSRYLASLDGGNTQMWQLLGSGCIVTARFPILYPVKPYPLICNKNLPECRQCSAADRQQAGRPLT